MCIDMVTLAAKVWGMTSDSNDLQHFLTAKEAAALTGYSLQTIYGLVHRGEIPFHRRKKGTGLRFVRSELEAWLKGEDGAEGAA